MDETAVERDLRPPTDSIVWHLTLAHDYAAAGELDAAEREGQIVLREAQAVGDKLYVARALRQLANVSILRGDYLTSSRRLKSSLDLAQELGANKTACMCQYSLARQLQTRGQLREAEGALGEALMYAQRARTTADPPTAYLEGMVYLEYSVCRLWLGRLDDALTYALEALALFQEERDEDLAFFTLTVAADAAHQLGDAAQAEDLLAKAAEMRHIASYGNVMSGAYAEAAIRNQSAGDLAAAGKRISQAEALFDANCDFDSAILLHLARGRQLDAAGDHPAAAQEYFAAQHLAQIHQSRCHIAWIRLERVPGLLALGQLDQARAVLLDAELAFELFDAQINLGRTFCGWVQFFAAQGNRDGAEAALDRAAAIASKLGPQPGLHLEADLRQARAALEQG